MPMNPPVLPTLRTPRLLLREVAHADAAALLAIHAQNKFMPWHGAEPLADVDAAERLIDDALASRNGPRPSWRWALHLHDRPELIGSCALLDWRADWRSATLEFELSHAVRGRGLMREGLLAVLQWAFAQLELNRVEARVHHLNLAAMRLLRALGFEQEGCHREAGHWDGSFHDLLQFGLLRREFAPPAAGSVAAPPAAA
jgi:ribosomal-protein-alanine N-acetyltransferase